uniref:Uncharacterized protein n=1 Tax=Nicotiana tabacum TaxID=4097 RepID=A0A1S4BQV1_TOBAC|nr:PREDICTED: uncharacterized protein LOC107810947 [Nicotiana tabacum]
MSNLSKLEFMALDISGNNYSPWVLDAEIHLDAKGLGDIIKEGNKASSQDKTSLKERYNHLKATVLPRAHREWIYLRLQDYKIISEYNSAVYRIISQLKLCGEPMNDEDMLEKTLSTFHASNMILQQQYREKGFKKYSELISCLLVAEQHNTLLMKNHEVLPTGSTPFLEADLGTIDPKSEKRQNNYRGRINIRGRGKGRNDNRHGGGRYKQENNKGSQNNPSKGKAANAPIRIDVPVGQSINANESKPRLKRGRLIGSKDENPRKQKGENDLGDHNMEMRILNQDLSMNVDKEMIGKNGKTLSR